jgi:UPF0755 protein
MKYFFKINKLLSILFLLLFFFLFSFYAIFLRPNFLINNVDTVIYIDKYVNFSKLKNNLVKNKIISNQITFHIAALFLNYSKKVLRGAYLLTSNMNNIKAIILLKGGRQYPVKLVINNLHTKELLLHKVCKSLDISVDELSLILNDKNFLAEYGFTPENVLTMFVPNTYEFYWTISAKDFFYKMYTEYKKFWNPIRLEKCKKLNLNTQQVIILASIVQRETNCLSDARKISGVYLNRLKRKIPLCSCTSIQFLLNDRSIKRILRSDLKIDSAYNTYINKSLPPGPICMPSVDIIEATMDPEIHDFLYFSISEDLSGKHVFAKSLKEHVQNARKCHKALNNAKIFR